MGRPKKKETYNPTLDDIDNAVFCIKKRVAYVPEAYEYGQFYVKRLYLEKDLSSSKTKRDSYLRKDKTKSDRKYNRLTFNEVNAWKEVFRLYKLTRESLDK